jgi:hypothetical protein
MKNLKTRDVFIIAIITSLLALLIIKIIFYFFNVDSFTYTLIWAIIFLILYRMFFVFKKRRAIEFVLILYL